MEGMMGTTVRCPRCRHGFFVHGNIEDGDVMAGQEVVKCFECNRIFNPKNHIA